MNIRVVYNGQFGFKYTNASEKDIIYFEINKNTEKIPKDIEKECLNSV